ncbi:hypothetical protein [Mixta calida]|nr:hypothetical protein [Mixta calida]MDU6539698.1 hypothetical protein [Mixta calida]
MKKLQTALVSLLVVLPVAAMAQKPDMKMTQDMHMNRSGFPGEYFA